MNRRGFILGFLATPAIIRTPGLLMPVKPIRHVTLADWEAMQDALLELWEPEIGKIQTQLLLYGEVRYTIDHKTLRIIHQESFT